MHDGTANGKGVPDVVGLGIDPIYRMVRAEVPFDASPIEAEGSNPSDCEIWVAATLAFQCHTYLKLIEGAHGPEIRKQVEQVILYSLNRYGEAGDQLERLLTLTQQAVERYNRDLTGAKRDVGMSLETYLAIVFLVKLPDSPYFVGPNCEGRDIPYDILDAFSRCLARGARRLAEYYQKYVRPG